MRWIMGALFDASLAGRSLAMMSETYFFELVNPIHPSLKTIGNARVVGVIINESSPPELLLNVPNSEYVDSHSMDNLIISPALAAAV